ncbi:MAG: Glucoamylase [uncultured Rubrobacteraceae bacterium]|uniref:Glucoamylase n=1 Tax=uncultured Rubrobacteraceae bacterium TaxID=349277 RepID=A0A6J4RFL5_9ACTN|nr:MAG: Glucoamylase [uncultured Rubrobacteraceae bacterium]
MTYQPIQDYGIIGDMHSAALVGTDGSIDWLCFPHFDSPSVFAAILDDEKGGRFKIAPASEGAARKQLYWPDTNVLITRFFTPDGVGEVIDYMPVGVPDNEHGYHQLVRRVRVVRGEMSFRVECSPAFDYAREEHGTEVTDEGACFRSPGLSLGLATRVPLEESAGSAVAEFTLDEGEAAVFVLREIEAGAGCGLSLSEKEEEKLFKQTVEYWRRWLSKCTYAGRWREVVQRSALALKLLTFESTGAMVAAPTMGLPEGVGGERNWDYRYTWIRDAAFTLYGLLRIGFTEEAAAFMGWIEARCKDSASDGSLQLMYGLDGRHDLTEETLDHLDGYRGSRPVRLGNGAYDQLQLDIYGELMDAVYLYNKHGGPISYDLWTRLRVLVNWVCDNWQREDEGIWEVRGGRRHFVYSKLMCWVAVDRGLRLASKRSFPADRERWLEVRDEIYEEIMDRGWSPERNAFVQSYDDDTLDASNLIMPLVFFLSPNDPRMLGTLDATNRPPRDGGLVANSLVYRYDVEKSADGLAGEEGTFSLCTFWLVEALTRAGRVDEGRLMFEQMLGYANHLGLYAEEIGHSGEALGNFPQAFTHLTLISAAFNLDRALGKSS